MILRPTRMMMLILSRGYLLLEIGASYTLGFGLHFRGVVSGGTFS